MSVIGRTRSVLHRLLAPMQRIRRMQIMRALSAQREQWDECIEGLEIADIRTRTLVYIERMRVHQVHQDLYGSYRYADPRSNSGQNARVHRCSVERLVALWDFAG